MRRSTRATAIGLIGVATARSSTGRGSWTVVGDRRLTSLSSVGTAGSGSLWPPAPCRLGDWAAGPFSRKRPLSRCRSQTPYRRSEVEHLDLGWGWVLRRPEFGLDIPFFAIYVDEDRIFPETQVRMMPWCWCVRSSFRHPLSSPQLLASQKPVAGIG